MALFPEYLPLFSVTVTCDVYVVYFLAFNLLIGIDNVFEPISGILSSSSTEDTILILPEDVVDMDLTETKICFYAYI